MNHLKTNLFSCQFNNIDHNVAHLYEHLLISHFEKKLVEAGYDQTLYGWLSGETFPSIILLVTGFYSQEIDALFYNFITSKNKYSEDDIANEIWRIEAEEQCKVKISSIKNLHEELRKLDSLAWTNVESDENSAQFIADDPVNSVISLKPSKKDFKHVTVAYKLPLLDNDIKNKMAFLRFTPVLHGAVASKLHTMGLYSNDFTWPHYLHHRGEMAAGQILTSHKNITVKSIKAAAIQALHEVDLQKHKEEFNVFKQSFIHHQRWATYPGDYYGKTGLLASRKAIVESMNDTRVRHILDNIVVDARITTQEDWDAM